jgi:hypothetical protein
LVRGHDRQRLGSGGGDVEGVGVVERLDEDVAAADLVGQRVEGAAAARFEVVLEAPVAEEEQRARPAGELAGEFVGGAAGGDGVGGVGVDAQERERAAGDEDRDRRHGSGAGPRRGLEESGGDDRDGGRGGEDGAAVDRPVQRRREREGAEEPKGQQDGVGVEPVVPRRRRAPACDDAFPRPR